MAQLIKQGAEARVYLQPFFDIPEGCIAKERFAKTYRHPTLDQKLTARRVIQEARCLYRCLRSGIDTPTVYYVDVEKSTIYMENILGRTVKEFLISGSTDLTQHALAETIGKTLGLMHSADIIHGDLTTSNMLIRDGALSLVVIDFGLAYQSTLFEDKAVDLYVLERAFLSTHPQTEHLFSNILAAYAKSSKQSAAILDKLEEVRLRGRKRSMVG